MIALNHTLVGAAIGAEIDNLPAVAGLAIASHFVLDLLPHVDQGTELKKGGLKPFIKYALAGLDIFASLFIIILILLARPNLNREAVLLGAFSALLIDLIFNMPFWEEWVKKTPPFSFVYRFHNNIQEHFKRFQYSLGILTQIILVAFSLWIMLK